MPCSLEMKKLNRELRQWERTYNTVRPHQSLGYLTPDQFLLQSSSSERNESVTYPLDEYSCLTLLHSTR
jgi:hypothetical protein